MLWVRRRVSLGSASVALLAILTYPGLASGQESSDWDASTLARFTASPLALDSAAILGAAEMAAPPATQPAAPSPSAAWSVKPAASTQPAAARAVTEVPKARPAAQPAKTEPPKAQPAAARAATEVPKARPAAEPAKTEPPKSPPPAVPAAAEPPKSPPPAAPAVAEPPKAQPAAGSTPYNVLKTKQLTGDWFGVRTSLEKMGVTFSPLWIGVYEQNYHGGVNTHNACDWAGMFQYNLELDFGKMNLVPGGSFFMRGVQTYNPGVQSDVGSRVAPYYAAGSSGDFFYGDPDCILVDKWWWRQRLFNDRLEFRLGKILNVIDLFDKNAYASNYGSQFSNRALNHNLTIPVRKGIGAFLKLWPTDWLYFQTAAIDPDARATRTGFDTAFHGSADFQGQWEFGFTPKWKTSKGNLPGNYQFGWWYNPKTQNVFMNTLGGALTQHRQTGDVGFYLNFDQLVWKENDKPTDTQGLGAFLRYGYAHEDVNQIEDFWSIGTQYQGLIPGRDADVLAFGVAQSIVSHQYRREINAQADRETVYELYYAINVTPWLVITPDIQVITNPGGLNNARDAIVGGVRIKVAF